MEDKPQPPDNTNGASSAGGAGQPALQDGPQTAVLQDPDRQFDVEISNILRGGVTLATLVVTAGNMLHLSHHFSERPQYHYFHGQPESLTTIQGIIGLVIAGHGSGIMQTGVVLLLLTPIIRVAFSLVAFLKQRDWIYVAVALIVLTVLLYSLFGGKGGGA